MQYTARQEQNFWELDPESTDISDVLEVLNANFRTFGEGLHAVMEKKAGHPISDPKQHLKERCLAANIDIKKIASDNTLKNWFEGGLRPKKGEDSRYKMFAIAYALGLNVEDTTALFHSVYLDRAFNRRNYKELIYYYCLRSAISFSEAEALIRSVHLENSTSADTTLYTAVLAEEASKSSTGSKLVEYIEAHGYNFSLSNKSAKEDMLRQKELARKIVKKKAEPYQHLMRSDKKSDRERALSIYDPTNSRNKDTNSDNFLFSVITGQEVSLKKGTKPIVFRDDTIPKEIRSNFPKPSSFSENNDSYEELRKAIILLFSYRFWTEAEDHNEQCDFDDYHDQLDALLTHADLPLMYFGNPYDWLFMYCTVCPNSIDTFHDILGEVVIEPA